MDACMQTIQDAQTQWRDGLISDWEAYSVIMEALIKVDAEALAEKDDAIPLPA